MKNLLLTTILLVSSLNLFASPEKASNATYFTVNKTSYCIVDASTVKVTNGPPDASVSIPASVTYQNKAYDVTSIAEEAFLGYPSLQSVTLPSSLKTIGRHAFAGCTGLTSITIPSSVTSIDSCAFKGCTSLSNATFNNKLSSLSIQMFANCTALKSVTLPENLTSIELGVFYKCSSLASITLPETLTSIGYAAFYNCSSFSSITIPASVSSIGGFAFAYCSGLSIIYSNISNPGNLLDDQFNSVNKTTCILHVPNYTEALYKSANGWKDFTNIISNITDVNETTAKANVSLYPSLVTGVLNIQTENYSGAKKITIFTTSGSKTAEFTASGTQNAIDLSALKSGVYFVQIADANNQVISKSQVIKK